MAVEVTLSSAGVRELLRDPGVARAVAEAAEKVAAAARASAPVQTGEYRDSIHVDSDNSPIDGRARSRVIADAPHALIVESNTGNLARALGSI